METQLDQTLATLRREIRNLSPGNRLPSQLALTQQLNVSNWTLSRAMAQLQAEGLIRRKRRAGSVVTSPEPLRQVTGNLGLTATVEQWSSMSDQFLVGFMAGAAQNRKDILLFPPLPDDLTPQMALKGIHWDKLDALALFGVFNPKVWQCFSAPARPVVSCDMDATACGIPSVVVDNAACAELAVRHLTALGHRRLAQVGDLEPGRRADPALMERGAAFKKACEREGLPLRPQNSLHFPRNHKVEPRELRPLFFGTDGRLRHDAPTALFYGGGGAHWSLIRALEELGLHIPGQLSLLVCGPGNSYTPNGQKLTEVAADMHEMGTRAARMLFGLTLGRKIALLEKTPVRLLNETTVRPWQGS